ncbi:MAG TPA: hypothetical protein VFF06_00815 [Polyangia bacterium]|nr:hypothetical protein [Polyangia bacterium]
MSRLARSSMMRALLMRALVLSAALGASACGPSEAECGRLLDHFLDVEARDAERGFSGLTERMTEALVEEKRALRGSIEKDFAAKCRSQLSRAEVRCALESDTPESMDGCEAK